MYIWLSVRENCETRTPANPPTIAAGYHRWFDHRWGREIKESQWVKTHLTCGVKTNIVTAVEVTATETADSPYLPPFTETTAQNFEVREISGDKAYLSKKNLRAVQAVGGTVYIPFKVNSVGRNSKMKYDALWDRMFHFYNFNRAEFLNQSQGGMRICRVW